MYLQLYNACVYVQEKKKKTYSVRILHWRIPWAP